MNAQHDDIQSICLWFHDVILTVWVHSKTIPPLPITNNQASKGVDRPARHITAAPAETLRKGVRG